MRRILYYGIFFEGKEKEKILKLDENALDIALTYIHVTFRYLPNNSERINDVVGKEYSLKIIGRANNGKNSGLLVEIPGNLKKYYISRYEYNGKEIPIIPHITLSISKDSKNIYTRDLNFEMLEKPITVKGKFGYCIEPIKDDKSSRYITFEEVL